MLSQLPKALFLYAVFFACNGRRVGASIWGMMTPVLAQFGSPTHWLIFLIVVLVVFGARRLPEVARNLGKSLGEFKKARREFEEELMKAEKAVEPEKKDEKKEEAP